MTSRVARFTVAYLAVFAALGALRGERRFVAYLLVVGGLALVLRRAHRVARFSPRVCGALAVCGLLHVAGGLLPSPERDAPVLYETWLVPLVLKYDQLVHFTTSAVVTVVLWQLVGLWVDPARCGRGGRAVLAVLATLGLGALNEAFEFLSALTFADNFVGGLDNAGWDIVFNTFGALTAAAWLAAAPPDLRSSDHDQRAGERTGAR